MALIRCRQIILCSESSPISWANGQPHHLTNLTKCNFQLAVEAKSNKLLHGTYTVKNCIYQHRDLLKYLTQFMTAYKGKQSIFCFWGLAISERPKFAWLWTSLQSHDSESSSVRLDTDLYEFLMGHQKTVRLTDLYLYVYCLFSWTIVLWYWWEITAYGLEK